MADGSQVADSRAAVGHRAHGDANGADYSAVDFTPVGPDKGPGSNTGQKLPRRPANRGIVDFLTISFRLSATVERGLRNASDCVLTITGAKRDLIVGPLKDVPFLFCPRSCMIFDRTGEVAGRLAVDAENDRVILSLSGVGCRWVNLAVCARRIEELQARITRCDVAFDDTLAEYVTVRQLRDDALAGSFATSGRPPNSRFLDDHGSGHGCTLYVGSKGHRELCVYEKGKQLKDDSSPWVRLEARLYSKHAEVPVSCLHDPLGTLLAEYPHLATYIPAAPAPRRSTRAAYVNATAAAAAKWLKCQVGRYLGTLRDALGGDFPALIEKLSREGTPARWKSVPASELNHYLRVELCVSQ